MKVLRAAGFIEQTPASVTIFNVEEKIELLFFRKFLGQILLDERLVTFRHHGKKIKQFLYRKVMETGEGQGLAQRIVRI